MPTGRKAVMDHGPVDGDPPGPGPGKERWLYLKQGRPDSASHAPSQRSKSQLQHVSPSIVPVAVRLVSPKVTEIAQRHSEAVVALE